MNVTNGFFKELIQFKPCRRGNIFFWENGRVVQVVRAHDGKVLREIDTGQTFRRCFHRLATVKKKLFVCLNDCIKASKGLKE